MHNFIHPFFIITLRTIAMIFLLQYLRVIYMSYLRSAPLSNGGVTARGGGVGNR